MPTSDHRQIGSVLDHILAISPGSIEVLLILGLVSEMGFCAGSILMFGMEDIKKRTGR